MSTDAELVNFSEEHELNYILRKVGKRQTEENRDVLQKLGRELKDQTGARILKSADFVAYVESKSDELA